MPLLYTVTATCADEGVQERYIRWLVDRHVAMVLATGLPTHAQVVRGREQPTVQTQYIFPSQASLDSYLTHFAPGLRGEGLALFGSVVSFARAVGTIEASWPIFPGQGSPSPSQGTHA